MQSLNRYLEKNQIDYSHFFRIFLVVHLGIILLIYFLVFSFYSSTEDILLATYKSMTVSLFIGVFFGLIVGFLLLLRPYLNKIWDIHVVVPSFLLKFVFIAVIGSIGSFYMFPAGYQAPLFNLGTIFGGMFTISAYNGEIQKEHLPSD